jgi:ADP-ribose pyrophosphatase
MVKKKIHLSSRIFLINKKYKKNELYHYIKDPNNVITIPIIKNKFILVSQKRLPINKYNYEFPSGWVDLGEKPSDSASRELLEETGYKTEIKPKKLFTIYPDPGRLSKSMICYYTNKLTKISKPEKGIKVILCTKKKIIELIKKGKFNSATHISAFLYYLINK